MKNKLLEATEILLFQTFTYGKLSTQLVLQAGLKCFEASCLTKTEPELRCIKQLEQWLLSPLLLSVEQKDDLRGASWSEEVDQGGEPGWEPLIGAFQAKTLKEIASPFALIRVYAMVLTHWEQSNETKLVHTYLWFLACLLANQDVQKKKVYDSLCAVADNLCWINKQLHPDIKHELYKVLQLNTEKEVK